MERKTERSKILVVDDEPSGIEAVSEILTLEGYVPQIFTQSADALKAFQKDRFSLAFVDIKMPGMERIGVGFSVEANGSPPGKWCFMTGYGTFDNAVEAIKIGGLRLPAEAFRLKRNTHVPAPL